MLVCVCMKMISYEWKILKSLKYAALVQSITAAQVAVTDSVSTNTSKWTIWIFELY